MGGQNFIILLLRLHHFGESAGAMVLLTWMLSVIDEGEGTQGERLGATSRGRGESSRVRKVSQPMVIIGIGMVGLWLWQTQ